MKSVLVTGASGFLGGHVVRHLLGKGIRIIVSILPSEQGIYKAPEGVEVVLNEDIFAGDVKGIDVVIGCAFARSNDAAQLADGLDFTEKLIDGLKRCGVRGVINISSQGIYRRLPFGELATEDAPAEPVDMYSMAKLATEKMYQCSGIPYVTQVRLSSLMMKQRFLYRFVTCVKSGQPIQLNAPRAYASLMDVEDAAAGLVAIAGLDPATWYPVYNLGLGAQYSLQEYAETVVAVGRRLGYDASIEVSDNGSVAAAGVDVSRLMAQTGWKPQVSNVEMVVKAFTW